MKTPPTRHVLAFLLLLSASAWAQDRSDFDAETGRSRLSYPAGSGVDFLHMDLDISIPDMNERMLTARQRLSFRVLGSAITRLTLDAKLLEIERVASGRRVRFEHDGMELVVTFERAVEAGEEVELLIDYRVVDPPNGLYWTIETPAFPGRGAQIHSQGETELNSYWFPIHDAPNDRLTTDVSVTVPIGYEVSSNGRLEGRYPTSGPGGEDRPRFETFEFIQDKPHVPYLVTLVVGKFEIVDVGTAEIPMPVYVPPGRGGDVMGTFSRTAEMVEFFGERFDEPYPWDKYAQLVVWNFAYGGMENTSATTLYDGCLIPADELDDNDETGLISHELAHQWFGDLVTCNSWEHIWLNEGFATYCESLWYEHDLGEDEYYAEIQQNFDDVIENDRGVVPSDPAMVSKLFEHPDDIFVRDANPYPKGASILHMLRRRLGDEAFFGAIRAWFDEHKFQTVETDQLRRTFERASGQSLERFFDQWALRPGIPRLTVSISHGEGATTLRVTQTQTINADNPAFVFDLAIVADLGAGLGVPGANEHVLHISKRTEDFTIATPTPARFIAVNPWLDVLAEIRVEQAGEAWVVQLIDGGSLPARIQAARHLGELEVGADVLAGVASDGQEHHLLRTACVEALGDQSDMEALLKLAAGDQDSWRVRSSIATALGDTDNPDPDAIAWLRERIDGDSSTRVRVGAIRALGLLSSSEDMDLLESLSKQESYKDSIRRATLDALVSLDEEAGLKIAISMTGEGFGGRTRASALDAVAQLAQHGPNEAFEAISSLLGSRNVGIGDAAGEALVELRDDWAVGKLEAMQESARDPDDRFKAGRWLERLKAELGID